MSNYLYISKIVSYCMFHNIFFEIYNHEDSNISIKCESIMDGEFYYEKRCYDSESYYESMTMFFEKLGYSKKDFESYYKDLK